MDTKNVGVIGLGLMGTALTERLLEAGYAVWIQNRTREKATPLLARGAQWAENPLDVCDRVLISLYTTDTVEEVLAQRDGGLRPGQILIDTTTGEPEQTVRLGARLGARGIHYLDAPISGSSEQTHRELLEAAEAAGFGDADNSAIIQRVRTPRAVDASDSAALPIPPPDPHLEIRTETNPIPKTQQSR